MNILVGGIGGKPARLAREEAYWLDHPQELQKEKDRIAEKAAHDAAAAASVRSAERELSRARARYAAGRAARDAGDERQSS